MEEVILIIENETFKAKKDLLCEYSDYFRAMFSGNYVEHKKQEITIDMMDAASMKLILNYMENGMIDLTEHSLPVISDLAVAANFLQITELIKQIEYCLDLQLSLSNWMETLAIAERAVYHKLEQLSAAFGLFSFNEMEPEHIPTIQKLYWYLSHPYLDTTNEFDVFKFGFDWITNNETGADALMIILCCLDIERLSTHELKEMQALVVDHANSLASKVIECLAVLSKEVSDLTLSDVEHCKRMLCERFSERVYNEVLTLITHNRKRHEIYTPIAPMMVVKEKEPKKYKKKKRFQVESYAMYTYSAEKGLEKWIDIVDATLWGWSVVAWGPTKLVLVCGEFGRGSSSFMKDVRVYDTLRKEWTHHGVELPPRRHAGVAVMNNSLYIVGGVGVFRVLLETAVIYDLKQRSYRKIAKLPDPIQNPAVCVHENAVYAADHETIYRYEDTGKSNRWVQLIDSNQRIGCMTSYKGHIYGTLNYFEELYRFKPFVDSSIKQITRFNYPPATICNLGDRLIFFTMWMKCGDYQVDALAVEEYKGTDPSERPKVLWAELDSKLKVIEASGSAVLVLDIPPINVPPVQHHSRYLLQYSTFT